jgi:hypothetical protein
MLLDKQRTRHHEIDPIENLWVLERRIQQVRWLKDPVLWAKERLGIFLWSKQREIIRAVATHRRVAIKSCHEIGKSYISALIVGWWIDCHNPGSAYAVTSAPTAIQVRGILWTEIGRMHARGKLFSRDNGVESLAGDVNQVDWQITMAGGNREIVALGRKPDEHEPTAFQGKHAEFPMYLFDEACGMPLSLFIAGDSLIANDNGKAVATGNPDDPATNFHEICKPGSGWHVIEVSAFDTPNFTGEPVPALLKDVLIGKTYVEDNRRRWAPGWYWVDKDGKPCEVDTGVKVVCPEGQEPTATHPFWQSKILGKFPTVSDAGKLIPIHWLERAKYRWDKRYEAQGHPRKLGVDVGRGGDSSTGCLRIGPVFEVLWEDRVPDTMHTCGVAIANAKKHEVEALNVDTVGIGAGVVDRAKEVVAHEKLRFDVFGINVGEAPADTEQFKNRRAELWWALRTRFEEDDIYIDPTDEATQAELLEIEYSRTSNGKIEIETKEAAAKRGVPSPNRADSMMLANAAEIEVLTSATWR